MSDEEEWLNERESAWYDSEDETAPCELELLFYIEEQQKIDAGYAETQSRLRLSTTCRSIAISFGDLQMRIVDLALTRAKK